MSQHETLAEALAAFQGEALTVHKGKTASVRSDKGSYSYSYADLASIASYAYPLLARHGLSFACTPKYVEGRGLLIGRLMHDSGDSIEGELPITGATPQQIGSSLTYARRYLLGCLTGIVTDEDDDGAAASAPSSKPQQRRQPPKPPASQGETGELRTEAQSKKLFALLREAGIGDRDASLAYIADVIGHAIESTKDLTKVEAGRVIDELERDVEPPPDGQLIGGQ